MVRPQLPVASLLGLFSALLLLFPEVLMETPEGPCEGTVLNRVQQEALSVGIGNYNRRSGDSANYFKVLLVAKKVTQGKCFINVEMVKTTCEKKAGTIRNYEEIQKCDPLPGNPPKLMCYISIHTAPSDPNKVIYANSLCR
ncbi:cystatin-like [Erythrolamprus reginae]|uniref:cystatin-like n=1 Tax=Erythrolamprus reginae TaxID=121349 RepID=UPI00396C981F